MKEIILGILLLVSLAAAASAMQTGGKDLQVVPSVDLQRYSGKWFEIARYPNKFQRSCISEVTATYTLLEKQEIRVLNQCRKANGKMESATGKARLADRKGPTSKLEVRFAPSWLSWLPMVWGDYWVIDLAPDYSYSVIGTPDRKYLWVLSRTPQMEEGVYREILQRVKELGFEPGKLVRTRQ